jgi:hypothetical protein
MSWFLENYSQEIGVEGIQEKLSQEIGVERIQEKLGTSSCSISRM